MIINSDDKMLISHRRLYKEDASRFFIGVVEAYQDGLVRINGYSWQHNLMQGEVVKKKDRRTKVISLSSGLFICYQLPVSVDIEQLYMTQQKQSYVLSDGKEFSMDLADRMIKAES